MDVITRVRDILFRPNVFFERFKEKGIGTAFAYFAIGSLIFTIISTILGVIMQFFFYSQVLEFVSAFLPIAGQQTPPTIPFPFLAAITLIGYLFGLAWSFAGAGILHLWIIIFGGKKEYTTTYQLYAYSQTPRFVFGWIPVVSAFIWIYDLALVIIGTHKMYGIPMKKAVLMYAIPVAVAALFYIIFFIFMFGAIAAMNNPMMLNGTQ